jgi:hypothetical protein
MQGIRAAADATASLPPLSWRDADELSDWAIRIGSSVYRVHTAAVASGARRSDKIRDVVLNAAAPGAKRETDVSFMLPEDVRTTLLADPFLPETFELLLDWQYGIMERMRLPSWSGSSEDVAAAPAENGEAKPAGAGGAAPELVSYQSTELLSYFSTAIFGTPSKTPQNSARGAPQRAGNKAAASIKPEQVPLLWQLADSLSVRGVKSALLPLFIEAPLPVNFVMTAPAFERLKMCAPLPTLRLCSSPAWLLAPKGSAPTHRCGLLAGSCDPSSSRPRRSSVRCASSSASRLRVTRCVPQ